MRETNIKGVPPSIPRFPLANLPTPIENAARLTAALKGPKIYIKRDDLTGLATGGNKTRKLEFLIGDALQQGADTLITAGAPQSNHCRQTAAAARKAGMECHLVFGGIDNGVMSGNRYLGKILGAQEHWTEKSKRNETMSLLAAELQSQGKKPYIIPVGGSNSIGALGYVTAMHELQTQMSAAHLRFDHIVFATSSGGTQAGIVVGKRLAGIEAKLTAISIDQTKLIDSAIGITYQEFVSNIARDLERTLGVNLSLTEDDFNINHDFLGAGYGVVGNLEREAIHLMAQTEGILVDPVYSGRALGALITLIRAGSIKSEESLLFWHTGGESALHAYVSDIIEST